MTTRRGVIGLVAGAMAGGRQIADAATAEAVSALNRLQTVVGSAGANAPMCSADLNAKEVDTGYRLREIARLKRIASGDFTSDDVCDMPMNGPHTIHDPDADLSAMKSISANARRTIANTRWKERRRQSYIEDALRRLSRQFGITL